MKHITPSIERRHLCAQNPVFSSNVSRRSAPAWWLSACAFVGINRHCFPLFPLMRLPFAVVGDAPLGWWFLQYGGCQHLCYLPSLFVFFLAHEGHYHMKIVKLENFVFIGEYFQFRFLSSWSHAHVCMCVVDVLYFLR